MLRVYNYCFNLDENCDRQHHEQFYNLRGLAEIYHYLSYYHDQSIHFHGKLSIFLNEYNNWYEAALTEFDETRCLINGYFNLEKFKCLLNN